MSHITYGSKKSLTLWLCIGLLSATTSLFAKSNAPLVWTGSWATAAQPVDRPNMPPAPGLANNTFRQVIRVSLGGETLRMRFSNLFSKGPLTLNGVSIAVTTDSCHIQAKTSKQLKFNGKKSVTIAPNGEVTCDPTAFHLTPGSRLTVTIRYGEVPADLTGHPASRTPSYLLAGNVSDKAEFKSAVRADRWYTINRLEVLAPKTAAAIVVLGNSIADGRGSGIGKQNRWPDVLSERLLNNPSTSQRGVLNVSIGGSSITSGGPNLRGIDRLERDVFTQENVKWLILSIGVNDIGGARNAERVSRATRGVIDAYAQFIDKAHAKGIKVYGAPILPFGKSSYGTQYSLSARDTINAWIRTSGKFDAVIDFEPVMIDPATPNTLLPNVHDNDWLHPNQLGYRKMGESIDLKLFE
jgi:lysophospholipase L1-like esterase